MFKKYLVAWIVLCFVTTTQAQKRDSLYFDTTGLYQKDYSAAWDSMMRSKIPNLKFDHITYAKIKVMTELYLPEKINDFEEVVNKNYENFSFKWDKFIYEYKIKSGIEKGVYDSKTGYFKDKFKVNYLAWFNSSNFENDYIEYFT